MKSFVALILLLGVFSLTAQASSETIALPKLIETFMLRSNDIAKCSMGAGKDTPQIYWESFGVEGRPKCGIYESCRRGTTRVLLNGKEMQHLRKKLEPVSWEIFMYSENLEKFGPEMLSISPACDTVQCTFDFKRAIGDNIFSVKQICKAELPSFSEAAYEVTKSGKRIYVVVSENSGSGGSSTSLTLFFHTLQQPSDFCSEEKRN